MKDFCYPHQLLFIAAIYSTRTVAVVQSLTLQAGERIRQVQKPSTAAPITTSRSLWDLPQVEQWASERGLKETHLKSLYPTLLQHLVNQKEVTQEELLKDELLRRGFPKQHATDLLATFPPLTCNILNVVRDYDEGDDISRTTDDTRTTKLMIGLPNGGTIETVLLEHRNRATVCLSSQVGCARACTFCATGTMGLLSQVTSGEILQQVFLAQQVLHAHGSNKKIRNVVFMGMGEPMDNYVHVLEACRGLTHQRLFGLPARQITISTVGASPRHIRSLADHAPTISLAVSLHGATQALRQVLLPSAAAAADLSDLKAALTYYTEKTSRTAMLEYLLISGVNDTPEALAALMDLCKDKNPCCYINLIPYNPTIAGAARQYQSPSRAQVQAWADALQPYGKVHVRWSTISGRRTGAACGQLLVDNGQKQA